MQRDSTPDAASGASRIALRIDEACRAIGISKSQLYIEAAAGRLKIRKCGRRSIVLASEIRAWLDRLPEKAA